MTKRQLIDEIVAINSTATPRFLAKFDDVQLDEYLAHLRVLRTPRLSGDPSRYEKYFRGCPTIPTSRPQWRTEPAFVEETFGDDFGDTDEDRFDEEADFDDVQTVAAEPLEDIDADPADAQDDQQPVSETQPPETQTPQPLTEADDLQTPQDHDDPAELVASDERKASPTEPVLAAAPADNTAPLFADEDDDSASWLY